MTKKWKHGFDHTTANGQRRMMAISMGLDSETYITKTSDINTPGDYGCDPLEDDMFKMIPSGDIVNLEERSRRLKKR